MPSNKLAQYRYRLLDECFGRISGCTIRQLVDYISEKLREDFGVDGISERTVRGDISLMRSDWPRGFGAPIKVENGRYFYPDRKFSVFKMKLKKEENKLLEVILQELEQWAERKGKDQVFQEIKEIIETAIYIEEEFEDSNTGKLASYELDEKSLNEESSFNMGEGISHLINPHDKLYFPLKPKKKLSRRVNISKDEKFSHRFKTIYRFIDLKLFEEGSSLKQIIRNPVVASMLRDLD
ncbi:MAG: hypothetical protein GXO24_03375 [Chlorobi bacterium]|nr:hypothetical protein [Chlorobiota bacterium]